MRLHSHRSSLTINGNEPSCNVVFSVEKGAIPQATFADSLRQHRTAELILEKINYLCWKIFGGLGRRIRQIRII